MCAQEIHVPQFVHRAIGTMQEIERNLLSRARKSDTAPFVASSDSSITGVITLLFYVNMQMYHGHHSHLRTRCRLVLHRREGVTDSDQKPIRRRVAASSCLHSKYAHDDGAWCLPIGTGKSVKSEQLGSFQHDVCFAPCVQDGGEMSARVKGGSCCWLPRMRRVSVAPRIRRGDLRFMSSPRQSLCP